MALQTGLFAKVRSYGIGFYSLGPDQAYAGRFVPVYAAEAGAEVAVAEVGVGGGAFARGIGRGDLLIAGTVVVEEEGRREM